LTKVLLRSQQNGYGWTPKPEP